MCLTDRHIPCFALANLSEKACKYQSFITISRSSGVITSWLTIIPILPIVPIVPVKVSHPMLFAPLPMVTEVRAEQYSKAPRCWCKLKQKCSFVTYSFKYIQYIYNIRDMKYGYNSSGSYNLTTAAPSELVVK